MARKVIVELTDDLDGGKADETVTFALDGTNFEIDLSKKNATKLRSALEPYVNAGQKVGRARTSTASGRAPDGRREGGSARIDRAQNLAIREWAQRKGLDVSPRGRISRAIIEQYEAEAGR